MFLLFLVPLLTLSLAAQEPPAFCHSIDLAVQSASTVSWQTVERAFLSSERSRQRCYPLRRRMLQTVASDVDWTLQGDAWRIRPQSGQASYVYGDLIFQGTGQLLTSTEAWMWRSEDGGLDKLCLPTKTTWQQDTWLVNTSGVLHQADSDETLARENTFVLYGKHDQPLYGYADSAHAYGKDRVRFRDLHATACPLDDRAWSISAEQLDWSAQQQEVTLQNVRFYWYDVPFFYLSEWRAVVGGRDPYGWQSPKIASYRQDPLVIGRPYRLRSDRMRLVTPWVGIGNSLSIAYNESAFIKYYQYQYMLRSGFHRENPYFRYGAAYHGHFSKVFGSDSLDLKLSHMRDGWYAQYFSPLFFKSVVPNADIPSHLIYQRQGSKLYTDLSFIHYQKFSGPTSRSNTIGVPYLHVLPRLTTRYLFSGFTHESVAENLVADTDKDNYPETRRILEYLGYAFQPVVNMDLQLGGWLKYQLVDHDASWTNLNSRHTFAVPNVEWHYQTAISKPVQVALAYAYTGYVDQKNDPVFQRKWHWTGDMWNNNKIESVDRVYDRNRAWLILNRRGLFGWRSAEMSLKHIIDVQPPRVSLSAQGTEDPLIAHPSGVSVVSLQDARRSLSSRWVVVWPTHSVDYYNVDWSHKRVTLQLARHAEGVAVENKVVSVPKVTKTLGRYAVYKTEESRFDVGAKYVTGGLDHKLSYQVGWLEDRCCWKGEVGMHLTRWFNDDDASTDVFSGWQPSVHIRFSLKGLAGPSAS